MSLASNISVVLFSFTLSFEYVVAETMSYHKCAIYFSIRCRDHAHISLTKWDLRIPFFVYVYSLWEMFWSTGNALDFRPRGPWFESGRLQQFFFFTFFSFWPFTVPSPLNIKTRTIANNVINNHIYFIITLLSLDPLLFECNPYGRWLFLKSGFYILVFCEQYRRYFSLIFVDFWVCCSWDYMLYKYPLTFFAIRCQDHAHDHHHHHYHYRHHDNHDHDQVVNFSILCVIFIRPTYFDIFSH